MENTFCFNRDMKLPETAKLIPMQYISSKILEAFEKKDCSINNIHIDDNMLYAPQYNSNLWCRVMID